MAAKKLSPKQRLSEVQAFVDLCFHCINEEDMKEVSNMTHLSTTTLRRLKSGGFTLAVHFGTIQSLGMAAGLMLVASETRFKMAVIR